MRTTKRYSLLRPNTRANLPNRSCYHHRYRCRYRSQYQQVPVPVPGPGPVPVVVPVTNTQSLTLLLPRGNAMLLWRTPCANLLEKRTHGNNLIPE